MAKVSSSGQVSWPGEGPICQLGMFGVMAFDFQPLRHYLAWRNTCLAVEAALDR